MAEITNLNRYRKHKARAERRQRADENAVRHGLTKAEKLRQVTEAARAKGHLDQQKFEDE